MFCAIHRSSLLDPDGCMVRGSSGHYCFATITYNENTGAEARPGEVIMVVQCKKGESFVTGEVFPLDIGLLMGAIRQSSVQKVFTPRLIR